MTSYYVYRWCARLGQYVHTTRIPYATRELAEHALAQLALQYMRELGSAPLLEVLPTCS